MSEFPAYPATDHYVLYVTTFLEGSGNRQPESVITPPMSHAQAQELLTQAAAGESGEHLPGPIHLVAELEPGHLVIAHSGTFWGTDGVAEVRLARVLFSR